MTAQVIDVHEELADAKVGGFHWRLGAMMGLLTLFDGYDTRQIEAHPSGIPLFTLVDGRQIGGFSLHVSIVHFVSPELDQPLPPIQFASVFFSPDPFFSVVSVDNDTLIELAPVPEPGTLLLLATGLAGVVGARVRRRA